MKIHRFTLLAALLTSPAFAQTNTFPASGNVGIGTSNPVNRLSVNGAIGVGPDELIIQQTNFGYGGSYRVLRLGQDQPLRSLALNIDPLTVSGGQFSGHGNILIGTGSILAPNASTSDWVGVLRAQGNRVHVGGQMSGGELLAGSGLAVVNDSGNVGIGTANPQHKLAVNGTIKAKEIIVETTGWSDYVFADDYRLAPLSEVEAHIKTNKHLPGLPSAAQVAESGVNLGDVHAALLAKVEELTLHLIAQQKQLSAQQQALQSLQKENGGLQSRLQQLESR